MRKTFFLASTSPRGYRPSIRLGKHGHPMKSDERGSHDSNLGGDNPGGNSGTNAGDSNGDDNAGPKFDPSTFWTGEGDEGKETPRAGESAGSTTTSSSQQQQQEETPAQQLAANIKNLNFGSILDEGAIAELAEGKADKFHANLNQMGQAAVSQSIQLMIPIIAQMRDQMYQEMEAKFTGTLQSRDNAADLIKAIPSAADPAVRPMVDSIFERAMTITKGKRPEAIEMTKTMLRFQTDKLGGDIGRPPPTAADTGALIPSNTNWLEELAGR